MSVNVSLLRALLERSTDGPWQHAQGTPAGVRSVVGSCWIPQDRNDAELIAEMRNSLPELIECYESHNK